VTLAADAMTRGLGDVAMAGNVFPDVLQLLVQSHGSVRSSSLSRNLFGYGSVDDDSMQ